MEERVSKGLEQIVNVAGTVLAASAMFAFLFSANVAYAAYREVRRKTGDKEYIVNDDVDNAKLEIASYIHDVCVARKHLRIQGKISLDIRPFQEYRAALERAIKFYEEKRQQHRANEFISQLNNLDKIDYLI